MKFKTITPRTAKQLAGKQWTIDGTEYVFGANLRQGGEAFLYPLFDSEGSLRFYVRFLTARAASEARLERTSWLIAQRLDQLSEVFSGVPKAWLSTLNGRPPGINFDFTATLHNAIHGHSWRDLKARSELEANALPSIRVRKIAAKNLIAHLATLEQIGPEGMVHGDLSDGNFIIDPKTGKCYLIDFDAFVYVDPTNLKHPRLPVALGGVKGTPGYMPPVLESETSSAAFPFSDRHARDMLLIELLTFRAGDPIDVTPKHWSNLSLTLKRLSAPAKSLGLDYLLEKDIFERDEKDRPSSRELAISAGCSMPRLNRPAANNTAFKPMSRQKRKQKFITLVVWFLFGVVSGYAVYWWANR